MDVTKLINLSKYPINKHNNKRHDLIQKIRTQLNLDGCAIIKSFLTPYGVKEITNEAEGVVDKAHFSHDKTNAYFTKDDPTLDKNDPRRKFYDRSNAFIPADNFMPKGALRSIYNFKFFEGFIRDCINETKFYKYADPLADVIINVANEGNGFPWHFDTNNFTVTLAIQNSTSGGVFQYVPNIRKESENFEEVNKVLEGKSNKVVSLNLEPGDLQLFKGRYSLHRVSPIQGTIRRYVAIFSYVEEPNMVGSPVRTKQLYGKVLPIHIERSGFRRDTFID